MKICRIKAENMEYFCIYNDGKLYDLSVLLKMEYQKIYDGFYNLYDKITSLKLDSNAIIKPESFSYMIPIPGMRSVRDFYSFEDHVKNARKNKGLGMIPEWYKFPVFYFSCTPNVYPSDSEIKYPEKSSAFDYEMEIAAVIGNTVKDCHKNCIDSIFGFIIMNDWSLRDIQKEEMKVMLGPAKGKDYATSFGRYLVTRDEIMLRMEKGKIDLDLRAYVNGKLYSSNNLKNIYYSFDQMLERASESVPLLPGDVIGSGTFGTGCILELGADKYGWLKKGDNVSLESSVAGECINRVV
ncbi:MAG: fumarylacetoacetate hydrolase family protein [Ferroplasma sp.]